MESTPAVGSGVSPPRGNAPYKLGPFRHTMVLCCCRGVSFQLAVVLDGKQDAYPTRVVMQNAIDEVVTSRQSKLSMVTDQRGVGSDTFRFPRVMQSAQAVGWSETLVGIEPTSTGLQPVAWPSGSSAFKVLSPGIEPGLRPSQSRVLSGTLREQENFEV
jgi:hypothetical protein